MSHSVFANRSKKKIKGRPTKDFIDILDTISVSLSGVKWHEYVFYDKNSNLMQENKGNTFLAFGLLKKSLEFIAYSGPIFCL